MIVGKRMTPNPITATAKTTHRDAMRLMEKNHIRRLPVVDGKGRLIGIVSKSDLLGAGPSQATTLSVHEIYSLLDRLTLDQIMVRTVLAVEETCSLAEAARIMVENDIGSLIVLRDGEMVGIITETDIFKTFMEVMGAGKPGFRIDLRVPDAPGMLAGITEAFAGAGGDIVALTTFADADQSYGIISIKERNTDEAKLRAALQALEGVEIIEFHATEQDKVIQIG